MIKKLDDIMKKRTVLTAIWVFNLLVPVSVFAQGNNPHVLDSLPPNFSYRLDMDSFVLSNAFRSKEITPASQKVTLGCYNSVDVNLAFSITIIHPFLFSYNDWLQPKYEESEELILYAVKKSTEIPDSTIIKALDDYCVYGQANYYFQSKDYILFLYAYSINSQGQIENLNQTSHWRKIETQVRKNLDSDYSIAPKTIEIAKSNNPSHSANIIRGKYTYCQLGLPPKPGIPASQNHCSIVVNLKKNGCATARFIEEKKVWRKANWAWYMDTHYVYIDKKDGRGIYAYEMSGPYQMNSLLNNEYGGTYLRKTKQHKQ